LTHEHGERVTCGAQLLAQWRQQRLILREERSFLVPVDGTLNLAAAGS